MKNNNVENLNIILRKIDIQKGHIRNKLKKLIDVNLYELEFVEYNLYLLYPIDQNKVSKHLRHEIPYRKFESIYIYNYFGDGWVLPPNIYKYLKSECGVYKYNFAIIALGEQKFCQNKLFFSDKDIRNLCFYKNIFQTL